MNNEKQKNNKTKNNAYATMVLGFFLCFFMVGVYMITNTVSSSYALPTEIDAEDISGITTATQIILKNSAGEIEYKEMTDDFTLPSGYSYYGYQGAPGYISLGEKFIGKVNTDPSSGAGSIYTIDMFCLQILKGMPRAGKNYTRDTASDRMIDEGITYIINKAYEDVVVSNDTITLGLEDYYNAQIAIWIYQELQRAKPFEWCQAVTCAPPATQEAQAALQLDVDTLRTLKETWNSVQTNHASGSANAIYNYVVGAQAAAASTSENKIEIKSGDIELTLTDDKNYYETNLIEVGITTAVNTNFAGFNFILEDNEFNTSIVDEEGNTITDYSSLADKKFKIRIPASSIKEGTTAKISGDFSGKFIKDKYLAYKLDSDSQIALLATSTTSLQTVPLKLEITVPDTGVDYSQYIYIIGAMVLVIGLTVIYVNTKAKEI